MNMLLSILALLLSFTLLTSSLPADYSSYPSTHIAYAQFTGAVTGTINFREDGSKTFTNVIVQFYSGLTNLTGLYAYHIHQYPVPDSGDCTLTGGHLSPSGYPDGAPCDPAIASAYQEGDLSGKHGKLPGFSSGQILYREYQDPYLKWENPIDTIFGRSVVIHYPNGTRYACANIYAGYAH
ncbi:8834_t:CDS:2 [Paraglomus brasilianum]|uniref:8834_t:CDS:1 n=1 Tax=Paraglomus brasilianum TaxID=144538 RepID=A0A9N8WI30_9GLOM|nr:8834_t:CDS:2 [Paraglomus brasilianum]